MKKTVVFVIVAALVAATAGVVHAQQRDSISIVGSSTVYPFATVVAEKFGKAGSFKTPKSNPPAPAGASSSSAAASEFSTRTCRMPRGPSRPPSSRPVRKTGSRTSSRSRSATTASWWPTPKKLRPEADHQGYLPGAGEGGPGPQGRGGPGGNPYKTWKEVNASLPDVKIEVLGPPPTSGTRDAFLELGMEPGAIKFEGLKKLSKDDPKKFQKVFGSIREDGAYVEAGENDNLIVQKLAANPNALGIFGFSFLDQNTDKNPGLLCGRQPADL